MPENLWLRGTSPAFRLMMATSWLAPEAWRPQQQDAIRKTIAAGPDWEEYIALVDRHRTPALSWAALKSIPDLPIPAATRQGLQQRSDKCHRAAMGQLLLLSALLQTFNRAGITVMPLKGPLFSLELYGDPGLRHSKDIDLELTWEDVPQAIACVQSLGWKPDPSRFFPATARQWEYYWRFEHELCFVQPKGSTVLELHCRNHGESLKQTRQRWSRSTLALWQGSNYQAMNAIDRFLYLCNHGSGHAWFRAKWLGDVARLHAQGGLDWEATRAEARNLNQERSLLAALSLLQQIYGLPLPFAEAGLWHQLPALLIREPLEKLAAPEEFEITAGLVRMRNRLRTVRYRQLLKPGMSWRQYLAELTYQREDWSEFHLPDALLWAYAPLMPLFWILRRVRGKRRSASPPPHTGNRLH